MKTKYILHGGYPAHINYDNDLFFKEILKTAPKNTKILLVYFAKELDRIPVNKDEDMTQFEKNKGNKSLFFEVAKEKIFLNQIEKSDVVYIHGGNTLKIITIFKNFPSFKKLTKGKIVAGESAGANLLSTFAYNPTSDFIIEGLGMVPVAIIPHFEKKYKNKLDTVPTSLERLFLPEYKYRVFWI